MGYILLVGVKMPPKGYKHVSLRNEIYEELERIKQEKSLSSINDVIRLLLEYRDIYSKIEYILRTGVYTQNLSKEATPDLSKEKLSDTPDLSKDTPDKSIATPDLSKEMEKKKSSQSNVFCKPKQKIYDLKLYVDNLKQKGIKVKDFWDENDEICFEIE